MGIEILPQVIAVLVTFCGAFGLAAVPLWRRPDCGSTLGRVLAHPSEPGSMLAFVALPSFLILLTLARLGLFVKAVNPINSPDSGHRPAGR
jgi:hypothetical protein